jgi:hypothetical protein
MEAGLRGWWTDERSYEVHGEIMLLLFTSVFLCLWLTRRRDHPREGADPTAVSGSSSAMWHDIKD